jgi:hypothetical protein
MATEQIAWDTPAPAKAPAKQASPVADEANSWDAPASRQNVAAEPSRAQISHPHDYLLKTLKNVPKSAGQFVGGLYEAVTSPVQTVKALGQTVGGGALAMLPEEAQNYVISIANDPEKVKQSIQLAKQVGGMYADRYGSIDAIKRTFSEDPVGTAADLSTLLSGGALATTKVAPAASSVLTKAATATNPLAVVTKPIQAVAEKSIAKQSVDKQLNAVRDANVASAQSAGYTLTPGSLTPTGKNILAERIAGKSHLEQLASIKNQAVTDKLARKAVGIDETAPLSSDTMATIRKSEYAKGYEPIKKVGEIAADAQYVDDLSKIESIYTGPSKSFPGAVPDEVGKTINKYLVDKFDAGDAVNVTRTLRDQASANFNKGENALAKAQLDIANALENQIERSLVAAKRPDAHTLLEQFKLSRQRMAISHTLEDAIREGAGSVNAKTLARDLQSGKYMTGELKTIAEFANVFPRVSQAPSSIGTPGAGTMLGRSFSGMMGAGIGGMAGGGPGAMVGSVAPEITSAAMRNYMLSQAGQRRIAPRYDRFSGLAQGLSDDAIRNMLLTEQAGELSRTNKNKLAR